MIIRYLLFVLCFFTAFCSFAKKNNFNPQIGINEKAELPQAFIDWKIHKSQNLVIWILYINFKKRIIAVGKDISVSDNAIIVILFF